MDWITESSDIILNNSWAIKELIETSVSNESWVSSSFISTCADIISWNFRFVLICLLFFYRIATLIRVIKDSNARSNSIFFQIISILIIICFSPIIWLPLYIAIRPQWRKRDKTPRRDEAFQNMQLCENCQHICPIDHSYCTDCWEILQWKCRECHKKYSNTYSYCPFCGAPHLDV